MATDAEVDMGQRAEPRIEISRVLEDFMMFEVRVNGEVVDNWATPDDVMRLVEAEVGPYRTDSEN